MAALPPPQSGRNRPSPGGLVPPAFIWLLPTLAVLLGSLAWFSEHQVAFRSVEHAPGESFELALMVAIIIRATRSVSLPMPSFLTKVSNWSWLVVWVIGACVNIAHLRGTGNVFEAMMFGFGAVFVLGVFESLFFWVIAEASKHIRKS